MSKSELMAEGRVPTVNSKGERIASRRMTEKDHAASTDSGLRGLLGSGAAENASSVISGRKKQLDNVIDQASYKCGGKVKKMAKGGSIDGIAQRGKTRGKYM